MTTSNKTLTKDVNECLKTGMSAIVQEAREYWRLFTADEEAEKILKGFLKIPVTDSIDDYYAAQFNDRFLPKNGYHNPWAYGWHPVKKEYFGNEKTN